MKRLTRYIGCFVRSLIGLSLGFVVGVVIGGGVSAAQSSAPVKSGKTKVAPAAEVNFEELLVQGKYHFSDEAVTTVEEDKALEALLGVRRDFKDRINKSAARH